MADDLDDFLKQAAQRRAQRQQGKGNKSAANRPSPSPPPPRSESPNRTPTPNIPTAEVVESLPPYQPTVGRLAPTAQPSTVSRNVDQADERMASHLSHVFQHEISKLRAASNKAEGRASSPLPATLSETPATLPPAPAERTSAASMIKQLRDPQSLRMAIIAHEIMKRPWQ
jgi:hypothetical protein